MEPIVDGLENEFGQSVVFERINAVSDRGAAAMNHYGVRGHPSYVIVDQGGRAVWQFVGLLDEAMLNARLVETLQ